MQPCELSREEASELLKLAGLRKTFARISLIQCISLQKKPVSHGEVALLLENEGVETSTVFRCLIDLVEAGLISRIDVGDHIWRFEIRKSLADSSHAPPEHAHFVCSRCSEIECLHDLNFSIANQTGNFPLGEVEEILLKGICSRCRAMV